MASNDDIKPVKTCIVCLRTAEPVKASEVDETVISSNVRYKKVENKKVENKMKYLPDKDIVSVEEIYALYIVFPHQITEEHSVNPFSFSDGRCGNYYFKYLIEELPSYLSPEQLETRLCSFSDEFFEKWTLTRKICDLAERQPSLEEFIAVLILVKGMQLIDEKDVKDYKPSVIAHHVSCYDSVIGDMTETFYDASDRLFFDIPKNKFDTFIDFMKMRRFKKSPKKMKKIIKLLKAE